jgi:hypothetical protein
VRFCRDHVRDALRGILDREPDAGGGPVPREVDGKAVELVLERCDLDRPLRTREPGPVEEDDRRALVLAAIPLGRRLRGGRLRSLRRQFTSFRSTA